MALARRIQGSLIIIKPGGGRTIEIEEGPDDLDNVELWDKFGVRIGGGLTQYLTFDELEKRLKP